ncbi:RCC1 domain-containing protein RUG3, mitochondrial isoform X2 [Solanum dulcamara]|uniref:RCC1 domain-containing protein RUG3, mitochondrial isoform X2 n=1 Tax=Solanum dulcamara TaxID=45834 RepID=UPI0024854798|nr:RCC1 domain-containing protein RUG3, mitochondrial isoform X2 [Solanum dulcamara]
MAFYHRTRRALPICLWRRHLSSSSSSSKVPLLWESKSTDSQQSVTVQLYSWGRGASGQLGGGIEEIRIYPSPVASFSLSPTFTLSSPIPGRLPSAPVLLPSSFIEGNVGVEIGISCGLFHSALLVDGNLWIWGKGDGGRLGFGHENPVFVPTLNTHLDSVRSVALGGLHSVALNSLGQVFTWGYGGFGALGHKVYHRELVPRLVEGSWDAEICHVATSGTHTAAITKSANSNYELGRGDKLGGWKPQPVPSLKGVRVIQIASGGYHSLALTDKGEVLSWGHGGHGQLGNSSLQNQKVPIPVEALANEKVIYISCGGSSSAAITDGGKLYMWGYAKDCQLGVPGLPEKQSSPIEVKFLMEDDGLGNHNVLSVAIGASHAMCLVSRSGH